MRDKRDLIEMYSIWVKPMGIITEAIAARCADEAIRYAKEYHKEQLILNSVSQQRELLYAFVNTMEFDIKHETYEEDINYFLENEKSDNCG